MKNLMIAKDSNFKEIEKSLSMLNGNHTLNIRFPNNLKEQGVFGIEGLVSQFIAGWLRNNVGERTFYSYSSGSKYSDFEDLSSSFYGICALQFSDKILTSSKSIVDKEVALKLAYERVRSVIAGRYKEAYKGMYVAIPAIKSKGINREFNNPFYNQKKVIGIDGFSTLTEEVLAVVVPQKTRNDYIEFAKPSISEMIRELFDNTHKHSRDNENGDVLEENFRGVIFNSIDVTPERLDKLVKSGVPGLVRFVADWTEWMEKTNRKLPVLDITIVDAGPGYARRWTGKSRGELSFEEEVISIVSCFKKNNSTSPNIADGSGLTHVLSDLRKLRGWFRLRTGSTSVSRSFFLGKGSIEILPEDVNKEAAFAEGVSFNLVIPLVDFDGEGYRHV